MTKKKGDGFDVKDKDKVMGRCHCWTTTCSSATAIILFKRRSVYSSLEYRIVEEFFAVQNRYTRYVYLNKIGPL